MLEAPLCHTVVIVDSVVLFQVRRETWARNLGGEGLGERTGVTFDLETCSCCPSGIFIPVWVATLPWCHKSLRGKLPWPFYSE